MHFVTFIINCKHLNSKRTSHFSKKTADHNHWSSVCISMSSALDESWSVWMQSEGILADCSTQGCRVVEFLWDYDSDSGTEKPGLWLRLRAQNQTLTPTLGPTVWHNDCVLKDDLREILNSSNKRCPIVYEQRFIYKINYTKVNSRWHIVRVLVFGDIEFTFAKNGLQFTPKMLTMTPTTGWKPQRLQHLLNEMNRKHAISSEKQTLLLWKSAHRNDFW